MRKILGLLFGLILAAPAFAQQSIPAPPVSYQNGTQSWYTINNGGAYLATASYTAWCQAKGITGCYSFSANNTTNLQNFFLDSTVLRDQLISTSNGFLGVPTNGFQQVHAIVEPGMIAAGSPVLCTNGLACDVPTFYVRISTGSLSGACTVVNWSGEDCGAFSGASTGIYQPTFMWTHDASLVGDSVYAKDAGGSNPGSGISFRTWEIQSVQAVSGSSGLAGSNYTTGHAGYIMNPDNPGAAPTLGEGAACTIQATAGGLTGCTLLSGGVRFDARNGAYMVPPMLQDRLYSRADYIAATGNTTFLTDGTSSKGCFVVVDTVSGAKNGCVRVTWWPDWCNGASGGSGDASYNSCANTAPSPYEGKFVTDQATTSYVSNLNVFSAGTSNDNTLYGPQFGVLSSAKNLFSPGQITSLGGYYGWQTTAIDGRYNFINPVQMPIGALLRTGQKHINQLIIDSATVGCVTGGGDPTGGGLSTSIGQFECFLNSSQGSGLTGTAMDFSTQNSVNNGTNGWNMPSAVYANLGSTNPLFSLDYMAGGNEFDIDVPNFGGTGAAVNKPIGALFAFGTHNYAGAYNYFHGGIDNYSGNLVASGTIPSGTRVDIWQAAINGLFEGQGTYHIWNAGVPTNGGSGTGVNVAGPGSLVTDMTNGNLYINQNNAASPTWNKFTTNFQDVQNFTSTATWTKPSFCTGSVKCTTTVTAIGAGGSGGGGAMETLGTVGSGGGGGGSGECVVVTLATADLGATQTATVATAPTGGLGATVAGPGADGNQGGNSFLSTFITAYGGGRGGGGQTAASSGGGGGAGINAQGGNATGTTAGAVLGTYSSAGGTAANGPTASTGGSFRPGAGGAGSSVTVAFTGGGSMCASGGGSGGTLLAGSAVAGGTAGLIPGIVSGTTAQGGAGGTTGGTGGAAVPLGGLSNGLGSTGSGGGGGNTAGAGGPGGPAGTATYGYGGGGGGAGTTAGGNGGVGGAGYISIVTTGQ